MSDDFMIRLERILEADTIDLRRLAEIGGGDPASFYVGTNLDGVDVRGQNLEGMKLTGLTPSRVRKDEDTQLPAPLEPAVEMIVLLAEENAGVRFISDRDPWIRFFAPSEEEDFFSALEGFNGAAIVMAPRGQLRDAFSAGHRLNLSGRTSVCLSIESPLVGRRNLILPKEAGPFRRVISVVSSLYLSGAVGADLRMLLKLLRRSRHWEEVLHMAPQPVSYFTRTPVRPSAQPLEAAASMFDRAASLGLETHGCMLFAPYRTNWMRDEVEWSRLIRPQSVSSGVDRRVLAALLSPPKSLDPAHDFVVDLAELLSSMGWSGVGTGHTEGRAELLLRLQDLEVRLPVIDPLSMTERRDLPTSFSGETAHFGDINHIVLSPGVRPQAIVAGVISHQALAVTARDLLGSLTPPSSHWSLIANQLGRMQDEASPTELALYIRLLLASAFDQGTVHHRDSGFLRALAQGEEKTSSYQFKFLYFDRAPTITRAILAIMDPAPRQEPTPVVVIHLLVDDAGVAVSDETIARAGALGPDDWRKMERLL